MSAFELLDDGSTAPERVVSVRVPADCPYFSGHFPHRPILPAIGQLALVADLLERAEPGAAWIAGAEALRFVRPILPGDELTVRIEPALAGEATAFRIERAGRLVSEGRLRRRRTERR
ncbi:MAG TPA: hypothetical protein VD788_14685 [Candidatus Polarisedimenticolaceae bacterium]|nr:hypothetical protein [Candidatus Polarisedimenticolaceae bacterium]